MTTQGSFSKRNAEDESDSKDSKKPKTEEEKKMVEEEKTEEGHFSQFYYKALAILLTNMKLSNVKLEDGINEVITNFKYNEGQHYSDNDFEKPEISCGYFKRYCQLNTEITRYKILEAVNNCKVLQSDLMGNEKNKLNVVSIGGGSGFDIVGMLSAFYEKVNCNKLNVTVVDKVKRYKSFLLIVEFLLREGDFGNASSMFQKCNTSLSFLCEDVCDDHSQKTEYFEVVNNADIILLVRLLSTFPKDNRCNMKEVVCEDVVQNMKSGALLLFIDSPYLLDIFRTREDLEEIYRQNLEKQKEYFYVQGSPGKYFGNTALKSNAQIVVYTKKVVKND